MTKKPPKPPDREESPRHKKRKKSEAKMALKAALEALSSLTNAAPTPEHFEQYFQETKGEKNDRGAAILLATNLENAVRKYLT